VGQVVDAADRILGAVPTDAVRTVIHELATAFNGRAQDLRTIIEASAQYARETLAYQDQFKALLSNAPPVLDTVAAVGPQLKDALDQTKVLADLLDRRATDLINLAHTGTSFAQLFDELLAQDTPNLACLIKDLGDVGTNLSAPAQLHNLDQTLMLNTYFFHPVNAITPVGPFAGVKQGPLSTQNLPGSPARTQTWLRVRLLLPPLQPAAVAYPTPNRIPDTYPGAACVSQFGSGVAAGSEVGAAAPAEGGKVIAPAAPSTPAERQQGPTPSGGGTGPGNVSPVSAAAAVHAASHPESIVFLAGGILGLGMLERREVSKLRRRRRSR
jgi:hypothetical protein